MSRAVLAGCVLAWGLSIQFMRFSGAGSAGGDSVTPCADCQSRAEPENTVRLGDRRSCGTEHLSAEVADRIERRISRDRGAARQAQVAPAVIRIALHVIHSGGSGLLAAREINEQVDVLNASFLNVQFVLDSVDYSDNPQWFAGMGNASVERDCKAALQRDPTKFMNVYTSNLGSDLLGFATFPWDLAGQPVLDGVCIHYGTLPGGSVRAFDEGITLVHEAGHWCGLYHPFQGGCSAQNDYVADTPAEQSATFGCPNRKDSCRARGSDPIHNYMDYSDDRCLNQFTAGQYTRMNKMLALYRSALATP